MTPLRSPPRQSKRDPRRGSGRRTAFVPRPRRGASARNGSNPLHVLPNSARRQAGRPAWPPGWRPGGRVDRLSRRPRETSPVSISPASACLGRYAPRDRGRSTAAREEHDLERAIQSRIQNHSRGLQGAGGGCFRRPGEERNDARSWDRQHGYPHCPRDRPARARWKAARRARCPDIQSHRPCGPGGGDSPGQPGGRAPGGPDLGWSRRG